jgi:glycerophosphoryl diester phosphodiesterase
MKLGDRIELALMALIDAICARRPPPRPDRERLKGCRIISHRGEHDNRRVFENTLPAFDAAAAAGAWGIELDLRWTRDLVPVVIHDPSPARVFGHPLEVAGAAFPDLRKRCALIPALSEVVGRYGGRVHLMIEIKREAYPDPGRQNRVLAETLAPLTPQKDYHLISLAPEMLRRITAVPREAFVPIARLDTPGFVRLALREGWAGAAGHYLPMRGLLIRRLHAAGLKAGTGYSDTAAALIREVNRGVDWVFSNRAADVLRQVAAIQSASNRAAWALPFSSSTK